MELTVDMIVTILKGIALSITQMAKPSLKEINKMLEGFGMELIFKPQLTLSTPNEFNMTFDQAMSYLKLHNTVGDKAYVESDREQGQYYIGKLPMNGDYYIMNSDDGFSKVTDFKKFRQGYLKDVFRVKSDKKQTSQFGEFVLTFEEAINYLKDNSEGAVTYETAKIGAHIKNSPNKGWFAWYDSDGLGNSQWYGGESTVNNRYHSNEKWAVVA